MSQQILHHLYQQLLADFGNPVTYWPQWCASKKSLIERENIIIGMILVQRTSWHNASISLKNLKKAKLLSVSKIARLQDLTNFTTLIRPAGFYQSKPKRLFNICSFMNSQGGIKPLLNRDPFQLREELLDLKGIGPETADTILLYALDQPFFIIDEYTRRFVLAHQLTPSLDYENLQHYFQSQLKADIQLYQDFHALIIISQRGTTKSIMEIV